MTRYLPVALCLLLLAGCARKSPLAATPGSAANGQASTQNAQPAEWPAWDPSNGGQSVHKGTQKTAPQLGDQLLKGRDATQVNKAAAALGEMGDQGYQYLYKGMTSPDETVRIISLQSVPRTDLVKNEKQTLALMATFLRDPNPDVRKGAAARMAWFGKAGIPYMPVLQGMAQTDPDIGVRVSASTAAVALYEIKTGTKVTSATGDPFAK